MKTTSFTQLRGHTIGKPGDPTGRIYVVSLCPYCSKENDSTMKLTDLCHIVVCIHCKEAYEVK